MDKNSVLKSKYIKLDDLTEENGTKIKEYGIL